MKLHLPSDTLISEGFSSWIHVILLAPSFLCIIQVQRQLQLRIEAQGRYLQKIIEEQQKQDGTTKSLDEKAIKPCDSPSISDSHGKLPSHKESTIVDQLPHAAHEMPEQESKPELHGHTNHDYMKEVKTILALGHWDLCLHYCSPSCWELPHNESVMTNSIRSIKFPSGSAERIRDWTSIRFSRENLWLNFCQVQFFYPCRWQLLLI